MASLAISHCRVLSGQLCRYCKIAVRFSLALISKCLIARFTGEIFTELMILSHKFVESLRYLLRLEGQIKRCLILSQGSFGFQK